MPNVTLGQLIWEVTGDTSKLNSSIKTSEKGLRAFGDRATKLGKSLTTKLTLPILAVGVAIVKAASDAEETAAKFETVFSPVLNEAAAAAKNLSDNFGLSSKQAQELLGNTGDLLTGFGFTADSALDLSDRVNRLAVDLASFTNFSGGAAGASAALTKALLGERESVKSLGISILEVDVQSKVLELRQQGLTFETERQAKAYATLEIAMDQSKNAQGDFARTSDSFANQFRTLKADVGDLAVEFGTILLPVAKDLIEFIRNGVARFSEMDDGTKALIIRIAGFAAAIGPLLLGIGAITKAALAAKTAMALLAANPLFVAAGVLVAGIVLVGKAIDDNYTKKLQDASFRAEELAFDFHHVEEGLKSGFTTLGDLNKRLDHSVEQWGFTREEVEQIAIEQGGLLATMTKQLIIENAKAEVLDEELSAITLAAQAQQSLVNKTDAELIGLKAQLEVRAQNTDVSREAAALQQRILEIEVELGKHEDERAAAAQRRLETGQNEFQQINNALTQEIAKLEETAKANEALGVAYDLNDAKRGAVQKAIQELVDLGYKAENLNIGTLIEKYDELFKKEDEEEDNVEGIKAAYEELEKARTAIRDRNLSEIDKAIKAAEEQRDKLIENGVAVFEAEELFTEAVSALRQDEALEKQELREEEEEALEEKRTKELSEDAAIREEFRVRGLSEFERKKEIFQREAAEFIAAGVSKKTASIRLDEQIRELEENRARDIQEGIDAALAEEKKVRDKALAEEEKRIEEELKARTKFLEEKKKQIAEEVAAEEKAAEEKAKLDAQRAEVQKDFADQFKTDFELRIDLANEELQNYIDNGVNREEAEQFTADKIADIRQEAAEEEKERQDDITKQYIDQVTNTIGIIGDLRDAETARVIRRNEEELESALAILNEQEQAEIGVVSESVAAELAAIDLLEEAAEESIKKSIGLAEIGINRREDAAIEALEAEGASEEDLFLARFDFDKERAALQEELALSQEGFDEQRLVAEAELDAVRDAFEEKRIVREQEFQLAKAIAIRENAVFEKALAIVQIGINTAVAAIASAANPILAGIIIAAGIASAIAVAATPLPPLPTFQTGGIVGGTGTTDSEMIAATPGEMILNKEQQENLLGLLSGSAPQNEGVIYLDGEKVGRFVLGAVEDASDNNTIRINSQAVRDF